MKSFSVLIALLFSSFISKSQCFQIQTILVDACAGSQEGQNEMVTFQVGSIALNTANLSVSWPNNSWLGLTKNAATASDVATVNATINGCGLLKEPVSGVLPANAKVLLVTSTAWSPLAQSFVNLNDTLYIIFQTSGNTAGHFANYQAGGGLRTLTMTFSSPASCTDAVTYDRALLINQAGNVGGQDGAAVEFTSAGLATYVNYGCQAPFIPLSINAGPDKTICVGGVQTLTATTSNAYTSVNWSLGTGATGSFSPTNSLTTTYTAGGGDNGTIKLYCDLSKICGTQTITTKDSVNLTVLQMAQPVLSTTSSSVCGGQPATLSYSLSNASSTGTTSVVWLPSNATTPTISVNTANVYTINVTNSCGVGSQTISIGAFPSPTVNITANGPTQFCAGGSVILTANSNTGNYSWSTGATTQTISVNTSTTVSVTSTNSCASAQYVQSVSVTPLPTVSVTPSTVGLCAGQSVVIQANSNTSVTYTWSTSANTNTISVNAAGNYTVNVSNSCGNASATATVTNTGTAPSISASANPTVLCGGQTATLSLSGSTGTYSWSNGATTATTSVTNAGIYTATVTNSCGTGTTSISISSLQTPTVTVSPTTTLICNGQSAIITATSNESNFSWSTGAFTNTISVNTSGVRTVSVSNACGIAVASVTVSQNTLPVLNLAASSLTICPNGIATLTVTGGTAPYIWSNSSNTGSVVTSNGGVVTVSNTNSCGTATASITISVNPVNASILATPDHGVKPVTVSFTNNSTGGTTYFWDFGNGNSANTQTVSSQTYTDDGSYTVYLTVTNGLCFDTDSLIINVYNEYPGITIPNVFTPNGDSANDVFKITGFNIIDFNCVIFDRWGLLMYSWSDITKGWDGKTNSKEATDGNYFYLINAKDIDGIEIKKQGTFLLIR